jgi:hypothetical protein
MSPSTTNTTILVNGGTGKTGNPVLGRRHFDSQ